MPVGRVSMDMITVDLSPLDAAGVQAGFVALQGAGDQVNLGQDVAQAGWATPFSV